MRIVHTAAPATLSRVIRWATGGEVSHSLVVYRDPLAGCHVVIEAESGRGVVSKPAFTKLDYLEAAAHTVQRITNGGLASTFLRHLLRTSGSKYDRALTLLWLAPAIGNRIVGRERWIPRWESPDKRNCSEAIAGALLRSGVTAPGLYPLAHPAALRTALQGVKWVEEEPVDALLEIVRQEAAEAA